MLLFLVFSRFKQELASTIGRIVVINLSDISHGEQASLMNLFLSAQQMDLRFHVCSLAKTNPLLRQVIQIYLLEFVSKLSILGM